MIFSIIQIYLLACIHSFHYIADFVDQKDEISKNKSKCLKALTIHVTRYTIISCSGIFLALSPLIFMSAISVTPFAALRLYVLTFITHFITDFITSKLSSKYFALKRVHEAFAVIGFDQFIHYLTFLFLAVITFKITI